MTTRKTATFRDEPPASGDYKALIKKVKESSRERPTQLEGTPRFDQMPIPEPEAPTELSENTVHGLEAMAAEAERMAAVAEEQQPAAEEPEPEPEKSKEEQVREAIEARCADLDIGQYLMGGELSQTVSIVVGKLEVRFRTVTDLEEVYVDDELAKDEKLTGRQFIRRTNEFALATHIHTLNGVKWAAIFDGDGTVSDKAMTQRMGNVRKLHSPVFNMLVTNLGWFLDRVNNALTMEALGNG